MNVGGLPSYHFIERLKSLPFVDTIYLYGSRARNTHHPRSDIDLAIVCPRATSLEWQEILDIVENADTLLHIDCLRLDDEPEDGRLRQNIEKDRRVIYARS